jgi:hypothetical protein
MINDQEKGKERQELLVLKKYLKNLKNQRTPMMINDQEKGKVRLELLVLKKYLKNLKNQIQTWRTNNLKLIWLKLC